MKRFKSFMWKVLGTILFPILCIVMFPALADDYEMETEGMKKKPSFFLWFVNNFENDIKSV